MNLFVFGLGYSAERFVRLHRNRFDRVIGTARSRLGQLPETGSDVELRMFDGPAAGDGRIPEDLLASEVLLVSVPPGEAGDPVLAAFGPAVAASASLRVIVYLSTIGVYGDHGGAWIDEATPAAPSSPRLQLRLAAEQAWLDLGARAGKAVVILRLAGIYGPGRNALRQVKAGAARRIVKPGQVFNRIHVDDIAGAIGAAIECPPGGEIYNVADDEPAPPQDVVAYAASLLGTAPPPAEPFDHAELSPMARSFYAKNKRVSNRLMKEELGVALAYPSYREGLAALHAAGEGRD